MSKLLRQSVVQCHVVQHQRDIRVLKQRLRAPDRVVRVGDRCRFTRSTHSVEVGCVGRIHQVRQVYLFPLDVDGTAHDSWSIERSISTSWNVSNLESAGLLTALVDGGLTKLKGANRLGCHHHSVDTFPNNIERPTRPRRASHGWPAGFSSSL